MSHSKKEGASTSQYAYPGLDRLIHEHARLSVLTSLASHPKGLPFNTLKRLCALTDGNLSRHMQVLQAARLVETSKGIEHNRPQTHCRLTAEGRRRYVEYLSVLQRVVEDAAAAVKKRPARRATDSAQPG
jgi:DNA-binding MarR family transcriptional regulator